MAYLRRSYNDHEVRVISIYATPWRYRPDGAENPELSLSRQLPLGALEDFHDLFWDQLPRVLANSEESVAVDSEGAVTVPRARSWLFALPSDQVVAALDLEFTSPPLDERPELTVVMLECCAFTQLRVGGRSYEDHVSELARDRGVDVKAKLVKLPPERHQIVFASQIAGRERQLDRGEWENQILYRMVPPFRPQFMAVREPSGLNREKSTRGLVTPYTSLLYGHPDYIENSVFLTTVQAVGTAARFRQIWHRAHGQVRDFRYRLQEEESGKQQRADMEKLVDELGNLELDLSFSVETSADLGLLIPSLRIESFHTELYAAMELDKRADRVSRMFARLDSSIRSELTAIDIREAKERDRLQDVEDARRERAEERHRRGEFAVTVLTALAVPLGFLVAFFGINASQVQSTYSIWDYHRYWGVYLFALVLALVPFATLSFLRGRDLRRSAVAALTAKGPSRSGPPAV
jgi:hypothetical protein